MASSQWMVTTEQQYYAAFCPCLHAMDMCKHVGGNEKLGCLASLFCPSCFLCYMGPKIAAKSDIEESTASAVVESVCCFTAPCYASQINLEYHKQKKLEASNLDAGRGQWLMDVEDWYRDMLCCPCLHGKNMAEHVGDSGWKGCLLGCLCPSVLLCCTGPKIAELSDIPDSFGSAVLKTILPCTSSCYATSVYAEYRLQRQLGVKASPSQVEMQ